MDREDFPAHSNFCELALISLGYHDVFAHVGRNVKVHAPNGRSVPPLITGTFGGADFIHSLMGEATDHLSQVCGPHLRSVEMAEVSPRYRI